jgi:hypothetical protein
VETDSREAFPLETDSGKMQRTNIHQASDWYGYSNTAQNLLLRGFRSTFQNAIKKEPA